MKWLALLFALASVVLASCRNDGGYAIPHPSDWCYRFDFRTNDSMAINYGRWVPGVGYYTDENNHLGLTYSHSQTVNPTYMNVGIQKGASGAISVAAAGNIFGVSVGIDETIPAAAPASEIFDVPIDPGEPVGGAVPIGNNINITLQTNGALIIAYLDVYGKLNNPFGSSNCPGFLDLTYGPTTPTETVWATSMPTWTPEATIYETPTPTPTPSDTPTPAPSWSPTPTPTPTAHYYLGPVIRVDNVSPADYWGKYPFYWPNPANGVARGVYSVAQSGGDDEMKVMSSGFGPATYIPTPLPQSMFPDNPSAMWPGNAAVNDLAAATAMRTLIPAVTVAGVMGTPGAPGTPVGGFFVMSSDPGGSSYVEFRYLLLGWPSPSPTPTSTPTTTHTPSRTPAPLPFTQTPAGPTFTPNPRATSLPLPYGLPGNIFRGTNMLCAYGDGSYVWDFRNQSAYAQGWSNPFSDEPNATWREWVGMELPLVSGQRLGRFLKFPFNEVPGAQITGMSAFTPSENTWQLAAGFSPSRNPVYSTAVAGPGWNNVGPFSVTAPDEVFISAKAGNTDPLVISFLAVTVINCPGTPTATQPFNVNPPQATSQALPTEYNWMTPTGTISSIGTPWGTPVYTPGYGTPGNTPGPGTPTVTPGTATPEGTPIFGDGGFTGDMGQINQLGGDLFGTVNNLFGLGSGWLGVLSGRISGVIGAWNTAPVTAPPGVPLCQTNPTSNELCAIFYIIRYTILSGPAGVVIMPLATVVLDLFIVFMFIRMLRAILARIARLVET